MVKSCEDDVDNDDDMLQVQDIQRIWDDERAGAAGDKEDMDGFVDYEDEEGSGIIDERDCEERCRERKKLGRQIRRNFAIGSRSDSDLADIDAIKM